MPVYIQAKTTWLNWYPLAYSKDNNDYFIKVSKEQKWPIGPLKPGFVVATALRLIRALAF